jgi:hypothetical protein
MRPPLRGRPCGLRGGGAAASAIDVDSGHFQTPGAAPWQADSDHAPHAEAGISARWYGIERSSVGLKKPPSRGGQDQSAGGLGLAGDLPIIAIYGINVMNCDGVSLFLFFPDVGSGWRASRHSENSARFLAATPCF